MTNENRESVFSANKFDPSLDLVDLLAAVWERKLAVLAAGLAATIISVLVALWLPDIYRAEVLLAPQQTNTSGSVGSVIPQIGGLAGLAGIALDNGEINRTTLGLATLESRAFLSKFVNHHDLLVPLMASKGWDPESKDLLIDNDIYDTSKNRWVRQVDPPLTARPSNQEVYEKFHEIMSVFRSEKSGLVSVSIDHYSPVLAKNVLDMLVADLNQTMMEQAINDSSNAIHYLREQIERTSLAEMQSVFYRLIEEQTKIKMLAITQPDYTFSVIDPAVVPDLKIAPNRKLIVVASTILAFILAIAFVLIHKYSVGPTRLVDLKAKGSASNDMQENR